MSKADSMKINSELKKRKHNDVALGEPLDDATRETACDDEQTIMIAAEPNKR